MPPTLEDEVRAKDNQIATLKTHVNGLRAALQEISEGRGRYSLDPLTHCGNTVDDMKKLALDALEKYPEAK